MREVWSSARIGVPSPEMIRFPERTVVAEVVNQDLDGKTNGWKAILNTLTVHYGDRIADHIK